MFSGDDEEEDDVPYLVNADSALLSVVHDVIDPSVQRGSPPSDADTCRTLLLMYGRYVLSFVDGYRR